MYPKHGRERKGGGGGGPLLSKTKIIENGSLIKTWYTYVNIRSTNWIVACASSVRGLRACNTFKHCRKDIVKKKRINFFNKNLVSVDHSVIRMQRYSQNVRSLKFQIIKAKNLFGQQYFQHKIKNKSYSNNINKYQAQKHYNNNTRAHGFVGKIN